MFINPNKAIELGWIRGIKNPTKQVQPNAIDFTLDEVMELGGTAMVSENAKSMRRLRSLPLFPEGEPAGLWLLRGQAVYDGTSDVYVEVPQGVAAVLFTRSTFARNGVFILSGLYDSGYKGQIGFTIYTIGGEIAIKPGTRIGQIAFMSADSAGTYAGGWNHEQGTHYTDGNDGGGGC